MQPKKSDIASFIYQWLLQCFYLCTQIAIPTLSFYWICLERTTKNKSNPYSLPHCSLTPLAASRHIMFVIFLANSRLGSFTGTLRISITKSFKVSAFPSNKSWYSVGRIFSSSSRELFSTQWRKGKVTVWLKHANTSKSM